MIIKIFRITNVMTFNICKIFHVFKLLNNFLKLNKVISNMNEILKYLVKSNKKFKVYKILIKIL